MRLLRREKPNFIIIHLLTALPLLFLRLFNFKTKFILRISGYPKLKFLRKILWKSISDKIFKVSCPSKELLNQLYNLKIFTKEKLFFLPTILNVKNFKNDKAKRQFKNGKENYFFQLEDN